MTTIMIKGLFSNQTVYMFVVIWSRSVADGTYKAIGVQR